MLILFLGLNWGAAPCLVATVLGTVLLYYLIYPPRFAVRWKDLIDMIQGGLVLFGGLFVSLAASQRERQRRASEERTRQAQEAQHQAEAIAASLAAAQAISERERTRLRAVLETLLAMVTALVQPEMPPASAEEDAPQAHLVSWRLAELTCHALGSQQVRLFALEPETGAPKLLAAVERSQECSLVDPALLNQHDPDVAWLNERMLARLRVGEVVQIAAPRASAPGANSAQFLVAPIQRSSMLLGLLTLDTPFAANAEPADSLALVQAIAKLGALLIEREHLLSEREAARAEALELSEAKRRLEAFLGIVSHELRTPLTSILLGLESGQRSLDRAAAWPPAKTQGESKNPLVPVQQRLGVAYRQSKRLERLVEELLESSLIEANRLLLRRKELDLAALARQAVEEQRQLAADRTIRLHLPAERPLMVLADAERLGLVLSNYLSNALKYSAEEKPVEVGVQVEGQRAQVWVQDAGPGIPEAFHAALWERFYRVPGIEIVSGSEVGLGLGLYISRKIIEQHAGQVGVQSVPGHGSRFWFTLPLLPEKAQAD